MVALVGASAAAWLGGVPVQVPAEGRDWILAVVCGLLGARVVAHVPRNPVAWLLLLVGLTAAGTVASSYAADGVLAWVRGWAWWPSYGLLVLIALLFPDGRPVTRRWRPLVGAVAVAVVAGTVGLAAVVARAPRTVLLGDSGTVLAPGWDSLLFLAAGPVLAVGAVGAVVAGVLRIRRAAPGDRAPLVWAAANAALYLAAAVADVVFDAVPVAWLAVTLAIPVAATVGVARYGLYDVGLLIHRSLLYGLFVVTGVAEYAVAAELAAGLVPAAEAPLAVAGTVAVLLPTARALDALVVRGLYGDRRRPYRLLTAVHRHVPAPGTPEEMLAGAATAIGEGLKLPYVAIRVGDRTRPEAAYGRRRTWTVTELDLPYRGATVGHLVVQRRSPDEAWSRRERALLADLVGQLAPAAASVDLTRDLQAARERLVRAREEELRRLRRELHDGVGPALAGTRMTLRAAVRRIDGDERRTLEGIGDDLAHVAAEIRHLLDGLRPAALDRGLAEALRAAVRRHDGAGPAVSLDVRGNLTDLPAAVEVTAYRLVDEALANVARHAGARHARVEAAATDDGLLTLEVTDDGRGGAAPREDGIGLGSMRERCEELGGSLSITSDGSGTRLRAVIPVR